MSVVCVNVVRCGPLADSFTLSAILFMASCYPPHGAKFMHARPQEKVGEAPEADVVVAGQKQVEEPCLL